MHGCLASLVEMATAEARLEIWVKDVTSRFIAVSGPFAAANGSTPAEMRGRTESAFFGEEHVARFRRDDRRAMARGVTLRIVEVVRAEAPFATTKRPIFDGQGRLLGSIGISRPLAERPFEGLTTGRRPPAWLQAARALIERRFRSPLRLSDLAEEVERSPSHLSRAFGDWYGVTPREWQHRLRVEWVANTVSGDTRPLSAIAQEAGFADQAHMTRVFGRYFGIAPAAYRRAMGDGRHPLTAVP